MGIGSIEAIEARGHAVHLYEDVSDLERRVAEYLAIAIRNGGVAIVAAGAARTHAFRRALAAVGTDVSAAEREGGLVCLDADEVSRGLTDRGSLDPNVFDSDVAEVVRRHARPGLPTHVYGEIVASLWRDGFVTEAIRLEELWNDLADEVPFSLLCAYPSELVGDPAHRNDLDRVCRSHTAVTGTDDVLAGIGDAPGSEVTRWFPRSALTPMAAREFVAETLRRWDLEPIVYEGALVTSELATNALLHAVSDVTIAIGRRGDTVRISLIDPHPEGPKRRPESATRIGGRGLSIIDALTERWGSGRVGDRKIVWAELSARPEQGLA